MPIQTYIYILTVTLVLALFFERFCFISTVYKSKNYGCCLILIVMVFNTVFLWFIQFFRQNKHKKRLFELYNTDQEPTVNICVAVTVSIIDLLKAFFLFWPANAMPMWLLISLLQLFIPLNMLLKSFCIDGVQHHKIHWIAALIIMVGCIVNMVTLGHQDHLKNDT